MYKPRWSAFYQTPLEDHLKSQGITTLVICGCNFPNGPLASVYAASNRDFRIVLATDALSCGNDVDPGGAWPHRRLSHDQRPMPGLAQPGGAGRRRVTPRRPRPAA